MWPSCQAGNASCARLGHLLGKGLKKEKKGGSNAAKGGGGQAAQEGGLVGTTPPSASVPGKDGDEDGEGEGEGEGEGLVGTSPRSGVEKAKSVGFEE